MADVGEVAAQLKSGAETLDRLPIQVTAEQIGSLNVQALVSQLGVLESGVTGMKGQFGEVIDRIVTQAQVTYAVDEEFRAALKGTEREDGAALVQAAYELHGKDGTVDLLRQGEAIKKQTDTVYDRIAALGVALLDLDMMHGVLKADVETSAANTAQVTADAREIAGSL